MLESLSLLRKNFKNSVSGELTKYSNENMKPTKITFIYELQAFGYHAVCNHQYAYS